MRVGVDSVIVEHVATHSGPTLGRPSSERRESLLEYVGAGVVCRPVIVGFIVIVVPIFGVRVRGVLARPATRVYR